MDEFIMKVIGYTFIALLLSNFSQAYATEIYKNEDVSVNFGGALRVRADIEPDRDIRKLNFDTLILKSDVNVKNYGAEFEYRILGGAYPYTYTDNVGDINFFKKAYFKYTDQDTLIQLGLNQVPIGSKNYFSNSVIETLGYVIGLEDLYKVGVKYQNKNLSIGFYPTDVWNGEGTSNGASYSNIVTKADSHIENGTNFKEKNTLSLRLNKTVNEDLKDELGFSMFYSKLDNRGIRDDGKRIVTGLDYSFTKENHNIVLNALYNKIDTDLEHTTFGGYDGTYNVANEGVFYSASYNYALQSDYLKDRGIDNFGYYINYSLYDKKEKSFNDSHRLIFGTSFFYKSNVYTALEWIIGITKLVQILAITGN